MKLRELSFIEIGQFIAFKVCEKKVSMVRLPYLHYHLVGKFFICDLKKTEEEVNFELKMSLFVTLNDL